jgi:hypothetical protein
MKVATRTMKMLQNVRRNGGCVCVGDREREREREKYKGKRETDHTVRN